MSAGRTIPISVDFMLRLADDLEDISVEVEDKTGRIFQLSDNVRKATARAERNELLASLGRLEDLMRGVQRHRGGDLRAGPLDHGGDGA